MANNSWEWIAKREPYASEAAGGYVTAINILAVEYLIKTNDEPTYANLCKKVSELSQHELEHLQFIFSFNKHNSTLGAMITQGDYDYQKKLLLDFLEEETE